PLRCDRASRQTALDNVQGGVRSSLFQTEWRFPLADLDLRPGKLMPVDENVRALERCTARVKSVALLKVAFDFEVELLREVAGEIDSCPAQSEAVFQCCLTEAPLKRGDIAIFEIRLDESTEHQFQFRPALLDINGRFLFFDDGFLDVRFSVVSNFL